MGHDQLEIVGNFAANSARGVLGRCTVNPRLLNSSCPPPVYLLGVAYCSHEPMRSQYHALYMGRVCGEIYSLEKVRSNKETYKMGIPPN